MKECEQGIVSRDRLHHSCCDEVKALELQGIHRIKELAKTAAEWQTKCESAWAQMEALKLQLDGMKGERDSEREIAVGWEKKCELVELQKRELEEAVLNLSVKYQQHNLPLPSAMIDAWARINGVLAKNPPGYVMDIIRAAVPYTEDPGPTEKPSCEHNWVDARNQHVQSGELCLKCHAIRAGNAVTDKRIEPSQKCSACGKVAADVKLYCEICYHCV
jgi:hypothetical protein